ncbi:phosphate ABC transporter substrate-binding protein PstS [Humisphaera borealis]|uniref:Phosphate-binding protein n=1 Tax=Humisphaera borealis TaxID=2807512 RepID=A0A7M2WT21_9BACT|nr:phosphate ABC transporter substrate-binding protein PstS [Humisphaera borealis]QOV88675.1 phosphate ABC transporter substrate-binding protein PstS [Humisphaera borealis]
MLTRFRPAFTNVLALPFHSPLCVTLLVCLAVMPGCDTGTDVGLPAPGSGVTISGTGSTFADPLYRKWFEEYAKVTPDTRLAYTPTGSSSGIRGVMKGEVDFGGTDAPLTPKQQEVFFSRFGVRLLHIPVALGGVVPAYNVPGVATELNFTSDILADIFLGVITRWNDPRLLAVNAGAALPDRKIVVMHRSDGSGTTYLWTDYLSKVSPVWKKKVGTATSVNWPVGTGHEGNSGVAKAIKETPFAVGYVAVSAAEKAGVPYGRVKNKSGQFVKAEPASVTAAAATMADALSKDFDFSITDAPGDGVYPITGFTWMLIPERFENAAKRDAMKALLRWGLSSGQDMIEPLGYARLPGQLVKREAEVIGQIK